MLKSCSIASGSTASCRLRPSSSLASTWITARLKPPRRSMEEDSDRPHLAHKILDPGAGQKHSSTRSRRPQHRGPRSPKLLGVLVEGERNSCPGYDLLICCHSELGLLSPPQRRLSSPRMQTRAAARCRDPR